MNDYFNCFGRPPPPPPRQFREKIVLQDFLVQK